MRENIHILKQLKQRRAETKKPLLTTKKLKFGKILDHGLGYAIQQREISGNN